MNSISNNNGANYQYFPELPAELNEKIFSYIPSEKRGYPIQNALQKKEITLNITIQEQQILIKNLVRSLINNIDKNYVEIIAQLTKLLKSSGLICGSDLWTIKKESTTLMFQIANLIKDIPYKDLNIENVLNHCGNLPASFEHFAFVVGLLKWEKKANEETPHMKYDLLARIAQNYIYLDFVDCAKQIVNKIELLEPDLDKVLISATGFLENVFEACFYKKQFQLASEIPTLMNKVKKIERQNLIEKYQEFSRMSLDQLKEKIDDLEVRKYLVGAGHFGLICDWLSDELDDDQWEEILFLESSLHNNIDTLSYLPKIVSKSTRIYVAYHILTERLLNKGFLKEAEIITETLEPVLAAKESRVLNFEEMRHEAKFGYDDESSLDIFKQINDYKEF